ncbi:MAG: AAA family ATPase [Methanosarcinaceae archaeon]|nr:AAA family ATPase [Methanosarcinaceae archaeon]
MTDKQKKALSLIKRLNLQEVLETKFGMFFNERGYAICPFHPENNPSFHVRQGNNGNWRWKCFGCPERMSGDYIDFRRHSDNVNFHDALRLICTEELIDLDAGYSATKQADSAVTFTYTDAKGNPLYRLKKSPPKQFYFERYAQGQWLPGLNGVNRTLYNLPALLDAKEVFLLEGEKDCETLRKLGFVATTMGSKNSWNKDFAFFFKNKDVRVCLDLGNEAEAEQIARDLEVVATSVRILRLPGLDQKEQDITDWFEKMAIHANEEKATRLKNVVSETPSRAKSPDFSPAPLAESILEFRDRPIKPRDIFMKYWLEREGLTMLASEHKTGKSILAMNVAISLALGQDFLNFKIPSARKVLLVQQEISEPAMKDRVEKMLTPGLKGELANLIFLNRQEQTLKISKPQDREILNKIVQDRKIDLLIFDPLAILHEKKESDNSDMSVILDYFAELMKKYSIGILVIHHFKKPSAKEKQDSYAMRGASVLGDRPDSIIISTRLPEKYNRTPFPQPFRNYAQLTFKLRNDEEPEDIVIERDGETLWYSRYDLPGYLGKKIPPTMVADIVKMNGGSCLQADVLRNLEGIASHRIAFEAISEARKLGLVKAQQLPGKGSPLVLMLPKRSEDQGAMCRGVA